MAGDPLRDAFRSQLATVVAAGGSVFTGWTVIDTLNTTSAPDANTSWITLRFGPAAEDQYSFGAPGANLWQEKGDVFVDLFPRLGAGHDAVETAALYLRNAFRHARFTMTTGQTVRILSVAPMFGGPVDGAWWTETVALGYQVFNTA